MSLVSLQPDFIAISYTSKKIAIGPDLCLPPETGAEKLVEAYQKLHSLWMDNQNHPVGRGCSRSGS